MKIDLWRALGITAAAILVSLVINVGIYGAAVSLETADVMSVGAAALILAYFSYLYFKGGPAPSTRAGFSLAVVMFGYTFATGFTSGFLSAVQGIEYAPLPAVNPVLMAVSAILALVVPTLVGWYMARTK